MIILQKSLSQKRKERYPQNQETFVTFSIIFLMQINWRKHQVNNN